MNDEFPLYNDFVLIKKNSLFTCSDGFLCSSERA